MTLHDHGHDLAEFLTGCWRNPSSPTALHSTKLARHIPLLLQSGTGALAWWRIRDSSLAGTDAGGKLQNAYLLHSFQAELHARRLNTLARHLEANQCQVMLLKGWSTSRLYPEPGLRPYGDVDLAVRPGHLRHVRDVLIGVGGRCGPLDLHEGVPDLADRSWQELWERSQPLQLGGACLRGLGMEDLLRHLAIHLMRHGAWRPLWLVDLAVVLENLPAEFDWDYWYGGDPRLTRWASVAIGLAFHLLQPQVDDRVPAEVQRVPPWIVHTALEEWGNGSVGDSHSRAAKPITASLCRPTEWSAALRRRWPNQIEAGMKMGVNPHHPLPAWMILLGFACRRGWRYLTRACSRIEKTNLPAEITIHSS